jgi:uncharacterized protein (DUF362 family)
MLVAGCGTKRAVETPVPMTAPTSASASKSTKVASAHADTYEPKVIYDRMRTMLDSLGGLGDVVKSGDRVAIKVNLTGGTYWEGKVRGLPGVDTFVTHPEVVRALGQLVRDAGAKELYIVEAVYGWDSFVVWGYEEVAEDLDATLVDLNSTHPYDDYATTAVPGGGEIYQDFTFNHILEDIDVFMSVSKMKCHYTCGVTHTMKNLVGLVPAQFYQLSSEHNHRSAFHGPDDESAGHRVPRIIVELNKARPIHFGVIDGIKTTEAGEGPWIKAMAPVEPHVLFAGKDVVATDAVATAAMDFDPTASAMSKPFVRADNHLELASQAGLGTHRLDEIEVVGEAIANIKYPFKVSN